MDFEDSFAPYSPERKGDLKEYLKKCNRRQMANLFYGPKYFFEIKELGLMQPNSTIIRVNRSPIPDLGYIVNSDYLLESHGQTEFNMSLVMAEKGIYDPSKSLEKVAWSINGLKLWERLHRD